MNITIEDFCHQSKSYAILSYIIVSRLIFQRPWIYYQRSQNDIKMVKRTLFKSKISLFNKIDLMTHNQSLSILNFLLKLFIEIRCKKSTYRCCIYIYLVDICQWIQTWRFQNTGRIEQCRFIVNTNYSTGEVRYLNNHFKSISILRFSSTLAFLFIYLIIGVIAIYKIK